MSSVTRRRGLIAAMLLSAVAVLPGCTKQQREGNSSLYLIVDSLLAAQGAEPDKFAGTLASDVRTGGAIYSDPAQVTLRLALKDPGTSSNPSTPTSANFVTVNHYRVRFISPTGQLVPAPFEGATTFTVTDAGGVGVFTLVPAQAKALSPLLELAFNGGASFLATIAEVTIDGVDQAGREVSTKASISVSFADWVDPGEEPVTPVTKFTVTPSTGLRANQAAQFDASESTVPAGRTVVAYSWNFGDGSGQTDSFPFASHVYTSAGTYSVTLVVTDSAGQTYTVSRTIIVVP